MEQILNSKRDASPVTTVDQVSALEPNEMLDYVVENVDHEWAYIKTVEELGEFLEKLTKFITKPTDKKPQIKEVLEEYLDLIIRGGIFLVAKMQENGSTQEEMEAYADEYTTKKVTMIYNYVKSLKDNT